MENRPGTARRGFDLRIPAAGTTAGVLSVADKLGLHAGIDVAEGPEDTHWHLTIGGSWN